MTKDNANVAGHGDLPHLPGRTRQPSATALNEHRRDGRQHPHPRPERASRRRSPSSSRSRTSTASRPSSTSTATRSTGSASDYIVGVRELSAANLSGQPDELDQPAHRLHPRLRLRRRDGERRRHQRKPTTSPRATSRRAALLELNDTTAGVLRRTDAPTTRSSARRGSRGVRRQTARSKSPTPATAASRSAASSPGSPSPSTTSRRTSCSTTRSSANGAKIIFNRDPRQRVQKVAPFLKVDGDPYPVRRQTTGHIVWMVDGYTTMANYPYSERQSLSSLTTDSLTHERTGPPASRTARSTTSATRSRPRSTPTTARCTSTTGTATTRCSRRGRRSSPAWSSRSPTCRSRAGARAVPGGPVRGAARAARQLPRRRPGDVLQRQRQVDRAD